MPLRKPLALNEAKKGAPSTNESQGSAMTTLAMLDQWIAELARQLKARRYERKKLLNRISSRERYRTIPEVRERVRVYQQRPEIKARRKLLASRRAA